MAFFCFAAAFGQTASNAPRFEVASVRPSVWRAPAAGSARSGGDGGGGGGCPQRLNIDRGRVRVECAALPMLIAYAFRLSPDRITGPDWMMGVGATRFDIAAKIPEGAPENQVPEMFQAVLAERFKLAVHHSTTSRGIYALVVAKGGLKLRKASSDSGGQPPTAAAEPDAHPPVTSFTGETLDVMTPNADGKGYTTTISSPRMGTVRETDGPGRIQRLEASAISFEGLAELLDRLIPSMTPVVDMTGVKGRYQLELEISLPTGVPAVGDAEMDREVAVLKAFNDGLRKSGLQLELRKGPIEMLVVDYVEKRPTEN